MGANLKQIANYLDNLGWDYRFDDEEDRIITGVEADNLEDFLIVVQLDEEGKFFRVFPSSSVRNSRPPSQGSYPTDNACHFLGNQNVAMGV